MPPPISADDVVHVRPDVQFEPLVNGYYAWLHLVSPATAALNFAKLHVPMLRSFLDDPERHRASARDPRLRGGMFVDLPDAQVDLVRRLAHDLSREDGVAGLAAAIDELGRTLRDVADGHDLTPLYGRVPDPLRGFVELVYDLRHAPYLRFNEPLLYRSAHATSATQRLGLARCTSDERPFAMTTPRFGDETYVTVGLPLAARELDDLFATATAGRRFGEIRDALPVDGGDPAVLASLVGPSPVPAAPPYEGDGVRVRYLGHACVVVEAAGQTLVADPFIAEHAQPGRLTHADLPERIDVVVITHGHQDHLELGTLLRLRHKVGTVVVPKASGGMLQDPSIKLCLEALGFPSVVDVETGDSVPFADGRVLACPFVGEHCDLDIAAKATYAVRARGRTVYLGADNRGVDQAVFREIRRMTGDVDVVFLGMECDGAPLNWLYGPLFSDPLETSLRRSRKLNGSDSGEAMNIVRGLRAKAAYVYAMGREPWLTFIMATDIDEESVQMKEVAAFVAECAELGIHAADLYGMAELELPPGEDRR